MDTTADAYLYAGVRMVTAQGPWIVELLAALLTPVIGVTTAYIAYRQWRTDATRLRHEQYERLAGVYRGVQAYLSTILRKGRVEIEDLPELQRATAEKRFLFDQEQCEYFEQLWQRSVGFWRLDEDLRAEPPGTPRKAELAQAHADTLQWFIDQLPELERRFERYLRLR